LISPLDSLNTRTGLDEQRRELLEDESFPPPPPSRRSGRSWMVAGGIGAAGILLIGAGVALRDGGADHPSTWDSRVSTLVTFVEEERGGSFEHPVEVEFLAEDDYVATLQDEETRDDGEEDEVDQALLRALGWIGPEVDAEEATQELLDDGTLAYYLPGEHRIVVRGVPGGDELEPPLAATLVHELTHAWQDQHLDLDRSFGELDEDFAFSALVEGDAMRIEDEYVMTLADDAQEDVADELGGSGEMFAPEAPGLELTFAGPYVVGPAFIGGLAASDGNRAVDAAFDTPPASSEHVVFPATYDRSIEPVEVDPPSVPEGAEAIDEPAVGGAWELFATVAGHVASRDALRATRAWAGGTQQAWREENGRVCLGWNVAGDPGDGVAVLERVLGDWASSRPAGSAVVAREGEVVALTACDPGPAARVASEADVEEAVAVLAGYAGMVAGLSADVEPPVADCVATKLVDELDADVFLAEELFDEELRALGERIVELAGACRGAVVRG
jgi:hypothetical protein